MSVRFTPSPGNVFEDLGLPDAVALGLKVRLAVEINRIVGRQRLTQGMAAQRLEVSQRKIAALKKYKLDEFSVHCLMSFLLALGRDVEIHITPRRMASTSGQIVVQVR